MAASCRNRTLSFSDEPGFRVLTATSFVVPEMDHTALHTLPNSPDPIAFSNLAQNNHNLWQRYIFKKHPWTILKITVTRFLN